MRVPTSPDTEKLPHILTPEEAAAIVTAGDADDARLGRSLAGALVSLALSTGLRLGELLALRYGPDGLDLDAGIVRVRANLDRVRDASGTYPELAPKSRASRRDVPLPAEEVARLRRHRLATGRPEDGALVFAGSRGEPLSPVPAFRAFKRACRAAKLAEATKWLNEARAGGDPAAIRQAEHAVEEAQKAPLPRLHDCRHAFATHALAAGLSAHAVARLLGHSDAGLVWRRYGHALPDELATAGERLSAWRESRRGGR